MLASQASTISSVIRQTWITWLACFERGVRVIQLVETANSRLAGSAEPGDDRGLTELGRSCLSRIAGLPSNEAGESRPIVDMAHLNPRSMTEVLEAVDEAVRAGRLLLMYSHGALPTPGSTDLARSATRTWPDCEPSAV